MARAKPTPGGAQEAEDVVTPLQQILTGTLLLSLILSPILAWGLYLAPFYKAQGALYRGDYFLLGLAGGIIVSAAFSYVWMAVLPSYLVKRDERHAARAVEEKAAKREAAKTLRDEAAKAEKREAATRLRDDAAKTQRDEEE